MKLPYQKFIRTPSKTAVKANLDFLNLGNQDDFITQCNDCIHAFNAPYREWCDYFFQPPAGECMKRTVKGTCENENV